MPPGSGAGPGGQARRRGRQAERQPHVAGQAGREQQAYRPPAASCRWRRVEHVLAQGEHGARGDRGHRDDLDHPPGSADVPRRAAGEDSQDAEGRQAGYDGRGDDPGPGCQRMDGAPSRRGGPGHHDRMPCRPDGTRRHQAGPGRAEGEGPPGRAAPDLIQLGEHRPAPAAAAGRQPARGRGEQPARQVSIGRPSPARVTGRRFAYQPPPGCGQGRPRTAAGPGRAAGASKAARLAPAAVSRYRCRAGRPGRPGSQRASSSPRSASRIKTGYSDPAFRPACRPRS